MGDKISNSDGTTQLIIYTKRKEKEVKKTRLAKINLFIQYEGNVVIFVDRTDYLWIDPSYTRTNRLLRWNPPILVQTWLVVLFRIRFVRVTKIRWKTREEGNVIIGIYAQVPFLRWVRDSVKVASAREKIDKDISNSLGK